MGHITAGHLSHTLPDGRLLLDDVSFRVGEGVTAALIGPNGAGKTTLLRMIAGDLTPQQGTVSVSGALGVMRQFVGGQDLPGRKDAPRQDEPTVRDLLISVSPSSRRGSRTSGCGCAAPAPASGR